MKIYISGAITKNKNYKQQFAKAQKQLEALGFEVINPAAVSAALPLLPYAAYMRICSALLMEADAICMLNGWERSCGATAELAMANALGLKLCTIAKGGVTLCKQCKQ